MAEYGTPEYEAWCHRIDESIRGRNALMGWFLNRNRRRGENAPPPPAHETVEFKAGYQHHARLYGVEA